jgi:hypothetical protein
MIFDIACVVPERHAFLEQSKEGSRMRGVLLATVTAIVVELFCAKVGPMLRPSKK